MQRIVDIPRKAQFLYTESWRYKVLKGGRSSAKSHSIAQALLIIGYKKKKRILCTREIQKSIGESVHQLLKDYIEKLGLQNFYRVTENQIIGNNGTQFLFAGLKTNFSSLKSKEGIDIVWVEEAAKVSEASWRVLFPTIRKAGSEIWVSFNPEDQTDPASKFFIEDVKPGAKVVTMNWQDNPWLEPVIKAEIDYDYKVDPETAAHVWGGEYLKHSKAQIFSGKYVVEAFESGRDWFGPYFGADFGFSQDPATLVKLWMDREQRRLYIEYEAYKVGCELNNLATLYQTVPGSQYLPTKAQLKLHPNCTAFDLQQPVIRGDNSRPETISHLRGYGFNVIAAAKWPGSVEDGITWLKHFEQIVIHPRCKHAETEARLYSFKVDPVTGDVLRTIVDRHNHIWDAVRYAMEPMIQVQDIEQVVTLGDDSVEISQDLEDYEQANDLGGGW